MKDPNAGVNILAGIAAIVAIVAIVATLLYFNSDTDTSQQNTDNRTFQGTTQTIPSAFVKRDVSEKELQVRLDAFSTNATALRADVANSLSTMSADMKTLWNTTSTELDVRFKDAKDKLDALKKESVEQTWMDLKIQASSSMDGLETVYLNAQGKFDQPE